MWPNFPSNHTLSYTRFHQHPSKKSHFSEVLHSARRRKKKKKKKKKKNNEKKKKKNNINLVVMDKPFPIAPRDIIRPFLTITPDFCTYI